MSHDGKEPAAQERPGTLGPADQALDGPIGAVTATIRALELLRQHDGLVHPTDTSKVVKTSRKWILAARRSDTVESSDLMSGYYEETSGLLTIDFFLDTSAAKGCQPDEEYVEFLTLLPPFRAQLPAHVRCRLWRIDYLRAHDLAFLLLLSLRSPDRTLAIPISHGIPDSRFHSHGGKIERLRNSSLRRLFAFQANGMQGIPRNDLCEGSCYHLERVRDWAALTQGKIFHTTDSAYLLTPHLFDLAAHWVRNGGAVPADVSLFSRSPVPYWYPKNLDGSPRTEPFDVSWSATDGTWSPNEGLASS